MEPIINPMFVYLANVFGNLTIFLILLTAASIPVFGIITGMKYDEFKYDSEKNPRPSFKWVIVPIILAIIAIFIPSQETCYKMMVAKMTTTDNIEKILKEGKNVKDELKKDLIDVIKSVKE